MSELLHESKGGQDPDAECKTKRFFIAKNAKRDCSQNEGSNKVTKNSKEVAIKKQTKTHHDMGKKTSRKSTTKNSDKALKKTYYAGE